MKRTLLAVGVAVMISMMLVPIGASIYIGNIGGRLLWLSHVPFFFHGDWAIEWNDFFLQTLFLAVLAAVIVNLFRRKPKT
jgi:hypothetical protein